MIAPTIEEITMKAAELLLSQRKGHLEYSLQVRHWHTAHFDGRPPANPLWYIEYFPKSLRQPFITVSGPTADAVLTRFQEELNHFMPCSLADIDQKPKAQAAS